MRRKALPYRACLVVAMVLSIRSMSQSVTLSGSNVPLEKVFANIRRQTGYTFFYTRANLQQSTSVTFEVKNMPLRNFLDIILSNQPLEYVIENKTIMVVPKKTRPSGIGPALIEGVIKDSTTGGPLAGATVSVFARSRSVITDRNGHYSISAEPGDQLMVSFIGYGPVFYRVTNRTKEADIFLAHQDHSLNEVTVTNGYQKMDGRKLTSAITTLKAEDIVVPGMFSIDQALEGRVPGLFVMNNSGEVGASPKVRIRGTSTILGNREPVWVVDGVVVNDPVGVDPQTINDLDFVNRLGNAISGLKPFDIEQIDVLKDASATALYGVRAANGVIVITTKKGHSGAPVVNFNNATVYTRRPRYSDHNINLMNSRERIDYSRDIISEGINYPTNINYVGYEGALNSLYTGQINYDQFQKNVHTLETLNTDWFKLITRDALSTQNNISISGGGEKMNYFASLGEADQQGTLQGEGVRQYTAFVKLNSTLSKKVSWDMNLRGNVEKRTYIPSSVNALSYAYNTSRAIPAYNPDGTLSYYQKINLAPNGGYYDFNILNEMQHSHDVSDISGINLITDLNYKVNRYLNATLLFSYANNNTDEAITYEENTFYAAGLRLSNYKVQPNPQITLLPYGGELQSNNVRNSSYLSRLQVNYDQPVGKYKKDRINALVGVEISSNSYKGLNTVRRGYLSDRGETFAPVDPLKYPAYAQWALLNNTDVLKDQLTNLASGYFSTSYTFNNKYILNFNTRTDFSNNFGASAREKFLPTWSVSGRWDVAEDLFPHSEKINMLALRASYGYQGNMLENQTPELIIKQGSIDPITGEYYSNIAYYPNPNLKWEKNGEVNLAVDFSLFHNKVNGSLTYFHKTTKNAFLNKTVPDVNGRTSYIVNSGTIENQGVEVAFSFTPINNAAVNGRKKGFVWRIDPQLGQVINHLLAKAINNNGLNQSVGVSNVNTYTDYLKGNQIFNGKAVNTFYSYQFNGLDHASGKPTFKNDGTADRAKYQTESVDQVYQQVMAPSGNRVPTIQGGISNFFSYGPFSLSFNLSYSVGSKVRLTKLYTGADDNSILYGTAAPLPDQNVNRVFLDRWRKPGDEATTNIPGLLNGYAYQATMTHPSRGQTYQYADNIWQMYDNSDVRVASGDFVKIKTLNFRYGLPDGLVKKAGIKKASVTLSGLNLYTFASKKLQGQDPEQAGFDDTIQLSSRPSFSFGIDLSF
ncbi:MAG TPA: SusC/RagA family TonB-linked outer membrane protein [Puia sp.]|nr:SusC/RagA family TonB-linked outer membrane protein [Puia sp.]